MKLHLFNRKHHNGTKIHVCGIITTENPFFTEILNTYFVFIYKYDTFVLFHSTGPD